MYKRQIEQVLSRKLGCASLGWLQGNEIRYIIHDHQDVAKSMQTLTTFRSAAADIQKIEMDNLSRRSTMYCVALRAKHDLPSTRIHTMQTLTNELANMGLFVRPNAQYSFKRNNVGDTPR